MFIGLKFISFIVFWLKNVLIFFGKVLIVKVLSGVWIDDIYIGC